jgi:hypothetical protein
MAAKVSHGRYCALSHALRLPFRHMRRRKRVVDCSIQREYVGRGLAVVPMSPPVSIDVDGQEIFGVIHLDLSSDTRVSPEIVAANYRFRQAFVLKSTRASALGPEIAYIVKLSS